MPKRSMTPCTYPGCPTLVDGGRCAKHTPTFQRDPAVKGLYNSKRWRTIRVRQLAREPWCRACLVEERYSPASDVDHIQAHRGDAAAFFAGPFQSLCKSCHSRKTAEEVGISAPGGRGGDNVSRLHHENAPGLPYEKNSQCGESA